MHFKLQEDPHHIACLHCQIHLKLRMFVELCAKNYATHDGLLNGADDIFKFVTPLPNNESLIYWINFLLHIGFNFLLYIGFTFQTQK